MRSTRPPKPALLRPAGRGAEIELFAPEDGVSPGQACVIYADRRAARPRARRRHDRARRERCRGGRLSPDERGPDERRPRRTAPRLCALGSGLRQRLPQVPCRRASPHRRRRRGRRAGHPRGRGRDGARPTLLPGPRQGRRRRPVRAHAAQGGREGVRAGADAGEADRGDGRLAGSASPTRASTRSRCPSSSRWCRTRSGRSPSAPAC